MKVVNFAIVGTGEISRKFIENGNKITGFNVSAVYSRDIDNARQFALKYNIPLYFDDLEEMASASEVDAVYIASPNSLHRDQAIIFANKRKDILCENVIATNTYEAREMIRSAKSNKVLLMEAIGFLLYPAYKILKENIKNIGKIRRISTSYCKYTEEYDAIKNGYILNGFRRELSNGGLMNMGVYCLYPIMYLFGKPDMVKCFAHRMVTGIDGAGVLFLKYEQMDGIIQYSKLADSNMPTEIQGEEGTIIIDDILSLSSIKLITKDGTSNILFEKNDEDEIYYEIEEFMKLLAEGKLESSINTYERSISIMETLDEARKQIGLTYVKDKV